MIKGVKVCNSDVSLLARGVVSFYSAIINDTIRASSAVLPANGGSCYEKEELWQK